MKKFLKKCWKKIFGDCIGLALSLAPETPSLDARSSETPDTQATTILSSTEPQQITIFASQAVPSVTSIESADIPSSILHATTPTTDLYLGPTEHRPAVHFTEQQTSQLSWSHKLWNAAYDNIETDEDTEELSKYYMATLIKVLKDKKTFNVSASENDIMTEIKDPIKRQEYMKHLVDEGRRKITASSRTLSTMGDIGEFIFQAKRAIDAAIQNTLQAALPWAGVCIGLQIILNPAEATKSNLAGISYVTSRMRWYCALTEHIFDEKHIVIGTKSFTDIFNVLKKEVIALYKALILYQMTSVYSYYRNQGAVFLRNLVNLDNWDGSFEKIKKTEAVIETMLTQYYKEYEKSSLHQLVKSGREMEARLGDIHLDLHSFISQQKQMQIDAKDEECLRDLFHVDPLYDMARIEDKKDALLDESFRWILRTSQFKAFISWANDEPALPLCRMLWIKGPAGTGKTMLLIGIIRELVNHSATFAPKVSHFFCQGADATRNNATAVLRSLIWMLLIQQPHLISHLHGKYRFSGRPLFTDSNAYFALSDIFKNMIKDSRLSRAYLIIDALDECNQDLKGLIQLILTSILDCDKIKWLVASRPEIELNPSNSAGVLVELDTQSLEDPVNSYINYKLSSLREIGYSQDVLAEISWEVHQRAANIFLWVALAFKQLQEVHEWDAIETIKGIPAGLVELYDHMMARIDKLRHKRYCNDILAAASLAYRPLSLPELAMVAGLPTKINPMTIIMDCGSFLIIKEGIVHLIHQSAKDYLTKRYDSNPQPDSIAQAHAAIFKRSIAAISKLQKNIYSLPTIESESRSIQSREPDPLVPVKYSCFFWAHHLCDAYTKNPKEDKPLDDAVLWRFLRNHLFNWLESLSLLQGVRDGIQSIETILQQLQLRLDPQLVRFIKKIQKFMILNGAMIQRHPLHIYSPSLIFIPMLDQTVEDNFNSIMSIAISPDGRVLASGSEDKTIRLWDITTGAPQKKLEGHRYWVQAVVFSPDGKTLVTGSFDETIRSWDVVTGAYQQMFENNGGYVRTVAFSPNGRALASGPDDSTIQLWDAQTGTLQQTLIGHSNYVWAVAFSSDGKLLASGSEDNTVRIWNASSGVHQHTLGGHNNPVRSVAFSPDGRILASASQDKTIRLWDVASGTHRQTLEGHDGGVRVVTFSPDGKIVASGSQDTTVRLWDITGTRGEHWQTLEGHDHWITGITFSPDGNILASGSYDGTVRLWNPATGELRQILKV